MISLPENTGNIVAKTSAIVRLFRGGPVHVTLEHGELRFGDDDGIPAGAVDAIEIRRSWFWTRLAIGVFGGTIRAVGGLRRDDAEWLAQALRNDAARAAAEQSDELTQLGERLDRFESTGRFRRHSQSQALREDIAAAVPRVGGALARAHLSERAAKALSRIEQLLGPEAFEAARESANSTFVNASKSAVVQATGRVLSSPLADEQAVAIATDEDVTLVLAGAGTGKTAVITGKVTHLVRNLRIAPQAILVLAFNRKAAEEIRERLPGESAGAHVATFHAFGRRVIADAGTAPTISKLAEDEAKLVKAVDDILAGLLLDSLQSEAVMSLILDQRAAYHSHFEFVDPGDYHDYIRRSELRTLSGDLVKSFEELAIANFLTLNRVHFEYESDFGVPTATRWHRQYQPDFYLPGQDIYIEHFALDREGRPPLGWRGYGDGVEWKRGIHAKYGTTLIETHSWQRREGVLLDVLGARLEEAGLKLEPIEPRELLGHLRKFGLTTWLARLIATFLNHVKTSGLSKETLCNRASEIADRRRAEAFLEVFEQVRSRYEDLLRVEKTLDFHDLINNAAARIREGRWESPYRYVLVDEFQDVSAGRMALLQSLVNPGAVFFLVGDDWQSIYRFAGSDVALMRDCGRYLGHVRERTLSQTFRFAAGILGPSTDFVVRNPVQTQRALSPACGVRDGGVTVVASDEPQRGLEDALRDIESREETNPAPASILVLGRYRTSQKVALSLHRRSWLHVEFSTVHGAKGREADYVIVLDLRDARRGFPSQIEDDPLLNLVLPPPPGGGYPHAEERRLFYVAMTRARLGAYLVADSLRPSAFVEELLRESRTLHCIGKFRRDRTAFCPRCRTGRLDLSRSGRSLYCLNFPYCRYRAPGCQSCRRGFLEIAQNNSRCTNPSCHTSPPVCESCGEGVMIFKKGRFGSFLGCTGYGSDQPCTNTRNLPSRT